MKLFDGNADISVSDEDHQYVNVWLDQPEKGKALLVHADWNEITATVGTNEEVIVALTGLLRDTDDLVFQTGREKFYDFALIDMNDRRRYKVTNDHTKQTVEMTLTPLQAENFRPNNTVEPVE